MITVPVALLVQGHQEHLVRLQITQDFGAVMQLRARRHTVRCRNGPGAQYRTGTPALRVASNRSPPPAGSRGSTLLHRAGFAAMRLRCRLRKPPAARNANRLPSLRCGWIRLSRASPLRELLWRSNKRLGFGMGQAQVLLVQLQQVAVTSASVPDASQGAGDW